MSKKNTKSIKPTFRLGSLVTFQMGRGIRTGKIEQKLDTGSLVVFCKETDRNYTVRASNAAAFSS